MDTPTKHSKAKKLRNRMAGNHQGNVASDGSKPCHRRNGRSATSLGQAFDSPSVPWELGAPSRLVPLPLAFLTTAGGVGEGSDEAMEQLTSAVPRNLWVHLWTSLALD